MGSMSDGLALTSIDGSVLYANHGISSITGLPLKAVEGRSISTLYQALQAMAVDTVSCEQALAQIESNTLSECVLEIKREQSSYVIHMRLFAVDNEDGQAIGRGLLLRDITREHELAEFKTTLLAAVSHEVRTPLAAIKGYASTLLQQDVSWSFADQQNFLQTISSEADRLTQLVSNLLDLTRQEAGLLHLKRMPIPAQDLVQKAIERLRHPRINITSHLPDTLPAVNVDGARIEVVLCNLIENALTYGNDQIYISADQRADTVILSVSDNGPGIAPDELPHVFERFYRARHGRQQRSGGTGLGLAISKAFIEAHGGTIWAESNKQGTTISFSLPLAVAQLSEVQT